jgi:hypothetical protein
VLDAAGVSLLGHPCAGCLKPLEKQCSELASARQPAGLLVNGVRCVCVLYWWRVEGGGGGGDLEGQEREHDGLCRTVRSWCVKGEERVCD